MSDSEAGASEISLTSPSQKFIPQDDDEETLWEVIEITAEKGNTYKVKWKGTDPKTMKPWPQSWVHKSDCTDDLVREWRLKQKLKAKGRSFKGRASTASKKTTRDSTSTVGTSNTKRPSGSSSKTTRLSTSTTGTAVIEKTARRSSLVPVITKSTTRKSKASSAHRIDDDDVEPSHATGKGKKRKLEDATSANSYTNQVQRHTSVDVNVDPEGEVITKKPPGRPRKKRKVQVEISEVESESEDGMDYHDNILKQTKQKQENFTGKISVLEEKEVEEEEEEERIVEDVLSQPSPRSSEFNIDDIYVQSEHSDLSRRSSPKDKGKGKAREVSQESPIPIKIGPPPRSTKKGKGTKSTKASRSTTKHVSRSSLPPSPNAPTSNNRAQFRLPTEERSVFWDGPNDDPVHEPVLSPAALERLAQFDEEVMGIPRMRSTGAGPSNTLAHATIAYPPSKEHTPLFVNDKKPKTVTNGRPTSTTSQASGPETGKSRTKPASAAVVTTNGRESLSRPTKPPPEVIPETDFSQSQSQENENDGGQPGPPAVQPSKPHSKSSPPSNLQDRAAKTKKFGPIPQLSPSVFHPHLPRPSPPPEDISEEFSQPSHPTGRTSKRSGKDAEEDDVHHSSIEQFDTPEKRPWKPGVIMAPKEGNIAAQSKQRESASEVWDSNIMRRGRELAEAARQREQTSPKKRKSLHQVVAQTRAQRNVASDVGDERPPPSSIPEENEQDLAGTSTEVVPSASGPQVTMDTDDRTFLEMERAYVDLSGGTQETQDDSMDQNNAVPVDPILLRHEEEESTQDIMAEIREYEEKQLRLDQDKMDGVIEGNPSDQPPAPESNSAIADTKPKVDSPPPPVEKIPEKASMDPAPATSVPAPRMTRARSRSQTPLPPPTSRPPSRASGRGAKAAKIATSSVVPPTIPEITEIDTGVTERLMSEMAELQAQLAAERAKNAELLTAKAKAVQETQAAIDQTTNLKAEHEAARLAWEDEKLHLTVQLDSARKAQASADKDVDFFREQYAKASGFVTSVREENKDLEKRIKIAEDQTQTGVNLVKATFELRCKTLEEDLKSWRRMAEFLIEKDRRTDNDAMRKRAAEEPELRALCQRQATFYAKAQGRIFELEAQLEESRREHADLESDCHQLKGEVTRLTDELSEATTKLERIGRVDEYGNTSLDETENAHEFVYRCRWRSEQNVPCHDVFSTISELEQHLLTPGGHLH